MKFAHIADTHIRNLKYQKEYRAVFEKMYETLRNEKVDYIVHCGDIGHTKTQISPEFVELCSDFFRNLESIAPTYIILGNHDGNLKNKNRQDAITPVVEALGLKNLYLLKDSGEVDLGNGYCLNVLSIFDEENWVKPSNDNSVNIALYHGSIAGVQTDSGWIMEHGDHTPEIFEDHDFAFLGDIHKKQIVDTEGRVRYCGSTIQQNHGESVDKGFLLLDIQSKDDFTCKHVAITNPKPFITIELTREGKIPNDIDVPLGARLRVVSNNNLPLVQMRRAMDLVKHKYKPENISFLNRAAGQRGDVSELTEGIKKENLRDLKVQEELIEEYLKDYEVSEEVLEKVFSINRKYNKIAEDEEEVGRNINWSLKTVEWDNLFNYGEGNSIDFSKLNGIVGIFGKNYSGKSSSIDSILYTIFNSTSKNERKNLNVINQNKESGSGRVVVTVDNQEYTIQRDSEKYQKKSQGKEITEAKTSIDFTSHDLITGEDTSHNGLTRNETDKNIRKVLGSLDDFLISSMSSQLDALSFLREGSTKRKEIFAKFLDLEIFEKKFKLAKSDIAETRGAIKRLEGRDFQEEIEQAALQVQENQKTLDEKYLECETLEKVATGLEGEIAKIDTKISSVPVEVIDIEDVRSKIQNINNRVASLSESTSKLETEKTSSEELKGKIETFLEQFDIDQYFEKREQIQTLNREVSDIESELELIAQKEDLLDGIPCGDKYPTCKFICDAYKSVQEKDSHNTKVSEILQQITALGPEDVEEYIQKYDELVSKRDTITSNISDFQVKILQNKNNIVSLSQSLKELQAKKELYEANKEAIENLEALLSEKRRLENNLVTAQTRIKTCSDETKDLYKQHGSFEERHNNLISLKKELEDLQQEFSAYDLFMKCMHSNGIAYDVIKKKLPVINQEIAKVLANIVDFEILFEDDGKRLNILIKHPKHDPRPLEMGSGAEKTLGAMAIRLALLSVSSLPKSDIFILDEPGTALDAENMEGFVRILDVVKTYFKTVLLITHLDSLKDCVDMEVTIEKKNGYALIKQ